MDSDKVDPSALPLHVAQALQNADDACGSASEGCHVAVMALADALTYYLGAVAVAQYSQALYTGQAEANPTLNRSLRSLKRILPGQWLGWAARGLESTPEGPVAGLAAWYAKEQSGQAAEAYSALRGLMVEQMDYTGEYGARTDVSPRTLLEMVDQYRIRRGKIPARAISPDAETEAAQALLGGLLQIIDTGRFLRDYILYAPQQRQLLMGTKATTPMPPISTPGDVAATATLLLYPPGEPPDYTKRPNLQAERIPLFPLDPLLVYLRCETCDLYVIAALREVIDGSPTYISLDPRCGHTIKADISGR